MNFFFDFDGTLVDVKEKYYKLYCDFADERNGIKLAPKTFWDLKRSMASVEEICRLSNLSDYSGVNLKDYTKEKIEEAEYLQYDKLIEGAEEVLQHIHKNMLGDIYIITMRRNQDNFIKQLKDLKINQYVHASCLPNQMGHVYKEGDHLAKSAGVKAAKLQNQNAVIVGDSGTDIKSGKDLGWVTVGVLSGLRNRAILEQYQPDYIIDSVKDFLTLIQNKTWKQFHS